MDFHALVHHICTLASQICMIKYKLTSVHTLLLSGTHIHRIDVTDRGVKLNGNKQILAALEKKNLDTHKLPCAKCMIV